MRTSILPQEAAREILVLDEDVMGDMIEHMVRTTYPGQYVIRKAPSIPEAFYWLDTTPSDKIHMILLGLREQENREFVCYLEGVNIRYEYNLVLFTDDTLRFEQQAPLHVEGSVSKWPFRLGQLLQYVERFADQGVGQLI